MIPISPTDNEAFLAKDSNPLGDGGKLLPHGRHDLRDTQFAVLQEIKNSQPRGVAHGAEQLSRTLERGRRKSHTPMHMIRRLTGGDWILHDKVLLRYSMIL